MTNKQLRRAENAGVEKVIKHHKCSTTYKYQDRRKGGWRIVFKKLGAKGEEAKIQNMLNDIKAQGYTGWKVFSGCSAYSWINNPKIYLGIQKVFLE